MVKTMQCAGCGESKAHAARGYCRQCYGSKYSRGEFQVKRRGLGSRLNPRHVVIESESVRRFWSKVSFTESCWLWSGTARDDGYGQFSYQRMSYKAHRVAYELTRGPIPDEYELDHTCRNRLCVNPGHLEPVTHGENIRRGKAMESLRRYWDQRLKNDEVA